MTASQPDFILATRDGKWLQEELEPFLSELMQAHQIPGLAIGVVKHGRIIYAKALGVRHLKTREPVTLRSVFHLASISKVFTGTGIMQLVERGNVRLDALVIEYLATFKLADPRYRFIAIRHLLNHTSGLRDEHEHAHKGRKYGEDALEYHIKSLRHEPLQTNPGEVFSYSDLDHNILGAIIAQISGMTFEVYMQQHIFAPLGMSDTTFYTPDVPKHLAVTGHINGVSPLFRKRSPYHRAYAPSATLQSNIIDMCLWLLANLNRGIWQHKRILQESSYDLLWTPSAQTDTGDAIGASWFIGENWGNRVFSHSGHDEGFVAYHGVIPERSVGMVLMMNSDSASEAQKMICDKVFDVV